MRLRGSVTFNRLVKYGLVGLLGALLHAGLLVLLVERAGAAPVPSSIAGFVLTVVVQYGLNRVWTFRSKGRRAPEFLRYAAVSVFGLVLNAAVMEVCVRMLSIHYLVGQAIAMAVIPLSNYVLNRAWTFRSPPVGGMAGKRADRNG